MSNVISKEISDDGNIKFTLNCANCKNDYTVPATSFSADTIEIKLNMNEHNFCSIDCSTQYVNTMQQYINTVSDENDMLSYGNCILAEVVSKVPDDVIDKVTGKIDDKVVTDFIKILRDTE